MEPNTSHSDTYGAWRDGNCLVFDVENGVLPAICIDTGEPATGEPMELEVGFQAKAVMAGMISGLVMLLVAVALGSFIGRLNVMPVNLPKGAVKSVFWLVIAGSFAVAIRFAAGRNFQKSWSIQAYINDQPLRHSCAARLLAFVLAPVVALGSILSLLIAGGVWSLVAAGVLAISLFTVAWGLTRGGRHRMKRHHQLACKRNEGKRLWIKGIHSKVLDKLPAYPGQFRVR